jgi:5'-deoxynucleotidase YfbR-like HD superfamily hydrolase
VNGLLRLTPEPVWSFRPDGSVRDLAAPDPVEIDFFAMANALSKIARFNGSNPGIAYSVAQHSVMGAEAAFNETGDTRLAAWFLLHDGEEYLLGDKPTPAQRLLNATISAATHTARRNCRQFMPTTRQQAEESGALAHFSWDTIKTKWL